jgi:prolyl-tRNA editing enzyme YbaK/EbsC (Cys-tRNA(Pro) deacylase)
MKLGKLEWIPASNNKESLSEPTRKMIASERLENIFVAEIDPALSDTAAFCEQYNLEMNICANCVIVQAKRAEKSWYAAVMVAASTRADINGIVRRALDARKISFAPMEEAVKLTGMEFGAINPLGLPADWTILVDERVATLDQAIIGSGVRKSKLLVSGKLLANLPNAQVMNLTKG